MVRVDWPARFEMMPTQPAAVIDCAHNVASAEALDSTMLEWFPKLSRSLIFASSSDKDVAGMFRVLAPHFERFYLTRSESPRAIPPGKLAEALPAGTKSACFDEPLPAGDGSLGNSVPEFCVRCAGRCAVGNWPGGAAGRAGRDGRTVRGPHRWNRAAGRKVGGCAPK